MRKSNWTLFAALLLTFCGCCFSADVIAKKYMMSLEEIVWCNNLTTALAITDTGLWRSTNEGQDWTEVQLDKLNAAQTLIQDAVDPNKVFIVGAPQMIAWTTTDCLATSKNATVLDFESYMPHPTVSGYMLAIERDSHSAYTDKVYITKDFGQKWTFMVDMFLGRDYISWGASSDAPNTIYMINMKGQFVYTTDFGATYTKIFDGAQAFALTDHHMFAIVDDTRNPTEFNLMVSSNGFTKSASYVEAQFPFGDDLPQFYTLLDDSTGAEWLGVAFDNPGPGAMYTSGSNGLKYTTTLESVYQVNGLFDFDVFHGLEGIYLANIVTSKQLTDLQTRISFDNGGSWQKLTPPTRTWDNKPLTCEGTCSLHLHGLNNWINQYAPPFYSTPNAVGLLIGTGNTGDYLGQQATRTYLSRDAGRNWQEILPGSFISEMGDHGGVLVFADLGTTSGNADPYVNQIHYTLDEGLTMRMFQLDSYVSVSNIIVEPSNKGLKFILYGEDRSGRGVVYGLDFSGLQNRTCIDNDYEEWSPRANLEVCLLGRNITYSRRMQTRNCFNSRDREVIDNIVNCSCTTDDYECDFGYEEQPNSDVLQCVLSSGVVQKDPPDYCPPGTMYEHTKGYRRIASDSCVNSLADYEPEYKKCPSKSASSHTVVAVVVVLVLVGFAVVGFLVYRNDELRGKVLGVVGKVIPGVSSGSSRYSRLGGMRPGSLADEEFGIGGEHDLDDSDVEEDAPELQDTDIIRATSLDRDRNNEDFNPRS